MTPAPPRALYAVSIQDALKSGDANRIKDVLAQAQEIAALIPSLQAEAARIGAAHGVKLLYAEAVQDAIGSGDVAKMQTVADQARGLLSQLEAEIKKR